jgi:hypothetical protein
MKQDRHLQFRGRHVHVVRAIIIGKPSTRHHLRPAEPERFDCFTQVAGSAWKGRVDDGKADQTIFVT